MTETYNPADIEHFEIVNEHKGIVKRNNKDELFNKELNALLFEPEIKIEAFNVYKSMKLNIKRGENRSRLKFFCVYNACKNLGIVKDPQKIAEAVNMQDFNLNKVLKTFSYEKTGYKMKDVVISPLQYIPNYYEQTGFRTDEIDHVLSFSEKIIVDDTLKEEYPQKVAASLIIYYITRIHNLQLPDKFFNYLERPESHYKNVVDKIAVIYNN
jgi:transcription initiation factor TFIIIB Brf1 subunit/transcription initiation factor TFIIB